MKKVGDLMEELGFRPDGSDAVKKAFVKNLIQQARVTEIDRMAQKKANEPKALESSESQYEQLSLFDKTKASS